MLEQEKYTQRFLEIVTTEIKDEDPNGPEQLLRVVVREYADDNDMSFDEAVRYLATRPNYEGTFGVNVYEDRSGEREVVFTNSDESTWVPLGVVVEAVDVGIWHWFDEAFVIQR